MRFAILLFSVSLSNSAVAMEARPDNSSTAMWERQEHVAWMIRASLPDLEARWDSGRYAEINAALEESSALIAALAGQADTAEILRFAQRDRVQALRARGSYAEAVTLFETLLAQGDDPPPFVRIAAADAYLARRLPADAEHEYLAAGERGGDLRTVLTGLMYAHLEQEDFTALADTVAALVALDPSDTGLQLTRMHALRFADRLPEAQALADALAAQHPDDVAVLRARAALATSRGNPRTALALLDRAAALAAEDPATLAERAGRLINSNDDAAAGALVARLMETAPEHPRVQRLHADWQARQRPSLTSEVRFGQGIGIVAGNRESKWTTRLGIPTEVPGLTVGASHHRSGADIPEGKPRHARVSAWAEYRQPDWSAALALGQETTNARKPTAALALAFHPNDHLSLRAGLELRSDDVPLKGRLPWNPLAPHLSADRASVGVAWRWHESRRVAADLSVMDFSDGNQRTALSASWSERLLSLPRHTLDLHTNLYTSRNDDIDVAYFNPRRDVAASLTLTADSRAWRHYERSFNHRLSLTAGRYRQIATAPAGGAHADYGWLPFHGLSYEHEWRLDDGFNLRYGVGMNRFPYDGREERNRHAFIKLEWRF